jgi:L-fucose/D-arabinose isomerase
MKIGFVSFGPPPEYNRKVANAGGPSEIETLLGDRGFQLIRVEIRTAGDLSQGMDRLKSEGAECLFAVLSHWTRISLVVNLVRSMELPAALYARTTSGYNGITALTAASAGLREISHTDTTDLHTRFKDGMEPEMLEWVEGVTAWRLMRKSRLMCWGGSYGANMPYTRSDPEWLESRLVAEVMTEQEVVLTDIADRILADESPRLERFVDWLMDSGLKVEYDERMCTPETVHRQTALYLAARDRLSELAGENIHGVSLKCHFELSTTHWGCTGCLVPAFLPFPEGPEGKQMVIPVACEGDLNGLVSLLMLHSVNPEVPPLFGDFVEYNSEYVLLRNCGSSSVYWAGDSNDPYESLSKTTLLPNMHGTTGAAVHYETPVIDSITACRLFRLRGEFHVFTAAGEVVGETEDSRYTDPWPHTRLRFPFDSDLLFQAYPCNHSSITRGNWTRQIEWICRLAGIRCHNIESDDDIRNLLQEINKT